MFKMEEGGLQRNIEAISKCPKKVVSKQRGFCSEPTDCKGPSKTGAMVS